MAVSCVACGAGLAGGRYCPACGLEQPEIARAEDPFVGRTIADRYEIAKLIGEGGMGRVYRAVQRSLDRAVAIKFIHPHLLTSNQMVARFMNEAQAASRLNHPNVVSIFDFGRTPTAEGGDLFLVMELLGGRDLATMIEDGVALPIARVATILEQTLAALSEAHEAGITHCDVKPENIILERRRGGGDHVKVIDFGIAKLGDARLTKVGQLVGTPEYMAPEQAQWSRVGPSADLYAVGVVLFLLLTGKLPFVADSATAVLMQQLAAPRPDPRAVAPERRIPDALAEVCLRSIAVDPKDRYPTAEALAEAIVNAASARTWTMRDKTLFSSNPSPPSGTTIPVGLALDSGDGRAPTVSAELATIADAVDAPSFRADEIAWARRTLCEGSERMGAAFHGRPGIGRTRLLAAIAAVVERDGARVVRVRVPAPPANEVGYEGLRRCIAALTGLDADDPLLHAGRASGDRDVADGLCVVFGAAGSGALATRPGSTRDVAAAALRWAVHEAVRAAEAGSVVLAIDDADRMDGASLLALADLLWSDRIPRFSVLLASEQPPDAALVERVGLRGLRGLSREEVARVRPELHPQAIARPEDVEPLYAEQLARWHVEQGAAPAPVRLVDLVEARIRPLRPALRRTLQAVALTGGGPFQAIAAALARRSDLDEALRPLADAGFVEVDGGTIRLAHAIFGRVALGLAPAGAIADLHERTAESLADADGPVELRAYHAVRGRPDFEAFLLVEETARLRMLRGDDEGAVAALQAGLSAARELLRRGELESATSAIAVFARKLTGPLLALDRPDEAHAALADALALVERNDATRALLLEQLAAVARHRGRRDDAERLRAEAHALATRQGDTAIAERLERPPGRHDSGPERRTSSRPPFSAVRAPMSSPPAIRDEDELGTFERVG